MAKGKSKKDAKPEIDTNMLLALSADLAVNRLVIDLRQPTVDEMVVFQADVGLRVQNAIKANIDGQTDEEKMRNAIQVIENKMHEAITKR